MPYIDPEKVGLLPDQVCCTPPTAWLGFSEKNPSTSMLEISVCVMISPGGGNIFGANQASGRVLSSKWKNKKHEAKLILVLFP